MRRAIARNAGSEISRDECAAGRFTTARSYRTTNSPFAWGRSRRSAWPPLESGAPSADADPRLLLAYVASGRILENRLAAGARLSNNLPGGDLVGIGSGREPAVPFGPPRAGLHRC